MRMGPPRCAAKWEWKSGRMTVATSAGGVRAEVVTPLAASVVKE